VPIEAYTFSELQALPSGLEALWAGSEAGSRRGYWRVGLLSEQGFRNPEGGIMNREIFLIL